MSGVPRFSHCHQPYSWPTGEVALASAAFAFPPHVCGSTLQILDLTRSWSDNDAEVIMLDDILALAAALYMFIKLNPLPQQRYPRTLPDLLTAGAELLTRHQPDDLPVLHNARTSQQVTHVEFRVLGVLGFELAALTPAAWVEVFSRRFPLWEQQLLLQQLHLALLVLQPVRSAPQPGLSRQCCGYRR